MNLSLPSSFSLQPLQDNFNNGISLFKDGLTQAGEKTVDCLTQFVSPINNFLKDVIEIEREFNAPGKMQHDFTLCLNGKMVPSSDVLKMDMEENY